MSSKCPRCGQVPYPVYDTETKKIIWKNLFHIDWMTMLILATVLFSAYAYKHDTAECRKMIEHPCEYIDTQQCLNNQMITLRGDLSNESEFYPYPFNKKAD